MTSVGAYEAKTHLPALLQRVEAGETIVITKHGREIAKLVPMADRSSEIREAIEAIRELRKSVKPLGDLTIKQMIEEGRRY